MIELLLTLSGGFLIYFGWFAYQAGSLRSYLKKLAVFFLIVNAIGLMI